MNSNRWVALTLLTATYVFAYADRYLLAMLVQPIKQEFALSDADIGLLTGLAFSAFYAIAGLPLGRLADRVSRRKVMAYSMVAWSVMTSLGGAARGFGHLLLARIGVGIGEAGCVPAAHSLISDLFPPERRTLAMSIFSAGGMIGMLISFALGATLAESLGWRGALVAFGLPGLLMAALIYVALPDPVRRTDGHAHAARPGSLRDLFAIRGFAFLIVGIAAMMLMVLGLAHWLPAFYERSFDMSRAQVGGMLAISQGAGSICGLICGGLIADRMTRSDPSWPLKQMVSTLVLALPLTVSMLLAKDAQHSLILGWCAVFFGQIGAGPAFAFVQTLVPPNVRASAAGTLLFATSVVGLGIGPLAIGLISDELMASHGEEALRYALVTIAIGAGVLAIACYVLSGSRVRQWGLASGGRSI